MGTLEELRESRDREATEGLESKMAKPAGFVRKEAQVQWQTSKIPFTIGGPGPADKIRTASKAAGHNLYRKQKERDARLLTTSFSRPRGRQNRPPA